jgi:hypothetical protein
MGQYYLAVILGEKGAHSKEIIRQAVNPHNYNNGAKLLEHGYVGNNFMEAVESLLMPNAPFFKSRLVWAGDYADPEADGKTLYETAYENPDLFSIKLSTARSARYVINHTKQVYFLKEPYKIHPLCILTAEGNGSGGGDYYGPNDDLSGTWARDVISVEDIAPSDYTLQKFSFGNADADADAD